MTEVNATKAEKASRSVVGVVVSCKMNKTIVVEVERKVRHPLYGKFIKRFTRLNAHAEAGSCAEGDTVTIGMCRPISKTKHWQFVGVVRAASGVATQVA